MAGSEEGSIFRTEEQLSLNALKVLNSLDVNKELGYTQIEASEKGDQELTDIFGRTVVLSDVRTDPFSYSSGKVTIDEARRSLRIPEHQFLAKDGQGFYRFFFDPTLSIIVKSPSVTSIMRNGKHVEGFVVEHVVADNTKGESLDLLSLRLGGPVENIFTFSGFDPFYTFERVYSSNETGGFIFPTYKHSRPEDYDRLIKSGKHAYPAQVLLSMPTREHEKILEWNPSLFQVMLLHENAHAYLAQYPTPTKYNEIDKERSVNAVALQIARIVDQKFPTLGFFDLPLFKDQIHHQLIEGYGALRELKHDQ